jgi:hypothetical protein
MQLTAVLTSLIALATAVSASPAPRGLIEYNVRYDATYDNPDGLISGVACSNLGAQGYVHFKDLPSFPNLAAWQDATYNSPDCGSCWNVTHNGNGVLVTVIDHSGDGFNVAESTFKLLNDNDLGPGSFAGYAFQVPASECGFPSKVKVTSFCQIAAE